MNNIYDNKDFFKEYSKMPRSRKGLGGAGEWHQLKELFPDMKNKTILDLGCGYGWHCKYAAENGAKQILGIDLSENMIREAKKKNNDPKIKYEVCGLDNFSYPKNTFDCVVSNLVLHYINDLDEIYKKVYRTLKPGGTFIFNIEHPIFTGSVNQEWIYGSDGSIQYLSLIHI